MEMKETIMKIGGDLKNSAEKLAKGTIDTSKKMAEKAKIKRALSQAESSLNAAYIELGKNYEELYAGKAEAEFAQILAEAADAKAKIAAAKAELAALDSASICAGCGKYVQEGQRFCPNCGMKQPTPAEAPAAPAEVVEPVVLDADGSEVVSE
ncbi:MAG: hypothetical protein IKC40_00515 [Oscillospiraceae bacterium]|nr:hypothetical protein [Oscillospiraceae bacterium]